MIRQIFIQEGTSRRRDRQTLENLYYEAIYTALQEDSLRGATFLTLKQLKAKTVTVPRNPPPSLLRQRLPKQKGRRRTILTPLTEEI